MHQRDDNMTDDTQPAEAAPLVPLDPVPLDVDALAEAVVARVAERLAGLAAKRYLSVAETAIYTSLSADAIRGLLSSGKLTGLRPVAGRIIIDKRELDALILSSTRRPSRGRGHYDRTG
jgi:hypothetical protein